MRAPLLGTILHRHLDLQRSIERSTKKFDASAKVVRQSVWVHPQIACNAAHRHASYTALPEVMNHGIEKFESAV